VQELLQQYVNNLSAGDQTTLIATLIGAIVAFFIIKMMTGVIKALVILAVLVVGAALLFPDAQVMDKVTEGAKTAYEKGKEVSSKVAETVVEKAKESVKH